ncbi:focadhesin, partial [Biomphalaria glabrata]
EPEQPHKWTQFGSTFHFFSELCGQLGGQSLQEGHTLTTWLVNLATTLEACCPVLNHVIAAVLITSSSDEVSSAALEVVKRIAIVDPKQSTDYLPLLLYVLNRTNSPERKLHILETLPCLATHKLCIPPILKTILALSKSADLKPISIRLMMLLWKQQERCFPQLLQLISDSQGSSSYQVRLAVASVILEICTHKPEQHGAELLTALTDILKTSSTEQDIPVSVLALRGLSKLCESEVMDLMSLWSYLGETFLNEARPLVVKELCGLLSLVPQLAVETQEYETFTKLAVMRLWAYSQSSNCLVCAAAYEALSKYSVKYFCVSYLPKSVTKDLYEQLDLAVKQMQEGKGKSDTKTDGDALDVDIMFPQIPGSCFVSILQSLTDSVVISAYKKLLQSLMATEITDLPRSVYFSSAGKKSMASQGGKILEKIPSFLLKQYNNCKQPGLRQGLAAGLLFCYDPPLEVSRDGRARKHYIIRHGKTFLETFVTLLQEVPIQTSDWHRFSLLPQAWNSFMERLFLSLLESRKADLELQEKHGHISSSDLAEKNIVVWLSTRDAILDAIKTTSRGSPTAQANCVLSLASLALCLHKYVTDLSADFFKASQDRTEYIGHSHWMAMTFDTILSFVDPAHVPKGNIHSICHQKSSPHDAGQPSSLCCAVARLATSQLVPLLVASDSDQIVHILKTFTSCLPTGQSALTSPVSIFCNGLALGMILEILFQEHFSDMTGSKGMLAVWKALTSLEDITYNLEVENRIGCVLGLTLAICAMCSDGKTESRVHATAVLEKLTPVWLDTPCDKDYYQVLTFTVACITTSVYSTNTLDISCVLPSIEKLNQVHQQYPQYSGVCLSLGLILFSLHRLGVEVATSLRQELLTAWLKDVSDDNRLPLEKVSKLNGLVSLIGSEQLLFPVISNSALLTDDLITGVVSRLMAIVGDYDDLGLQNISSWFLGHLYLSSTSSGGDKCTSVPGSLSYLPEWSLLRAFYDFLLDSGRSIPDNHLISLVNVALQVINVKTTLPPVNWAIMLSPYMRNNSYGDEVRANILQVAISQIQSPSAVVFISSWLTPPLYASLQLSCKTVLHLHMCQLIRSMSPNVLQVYLERSCLPEFSESKTQNIRIQLAILKGLRDALAVTDPPEAVTSLLHSATAQIYHQLTTDFNIQLLQSMAECLSQLPAEIMDNVIATDFSDASSQVKGCFVRCHLVATGKQPLGLLNFMIDAFFNADYWNQEVGMVLLFNCFGAYSKYKGENSSLSARQQWFLELLGHTRTVVIGAMPLAATAPTKDKVIRYIANIVTAAMLTLTYPACTDLDFWGFSQKLFAPPVDKITQQESQILDVCFQNEPPLPNLGILYSTMIQFLPSIIGAMSTKQWEGFLTKVIDWVLILCETDETDLETRNCLHATLMSLRNSQAFRSVSVWTKVIQLTC